MFASIRVIAGSRIPRGYQQITSLGSAVGLTVPVVANIYVGYAVIQCEGTFGTDLVRWRDDGVDPTSSVGMILNGGQEMDYSGDLTVIKFILSAGSPKLNISYYS